jgi:NADH-quinone oxidoreductase subunit A
MEQYFGIFMMFVFAGGVSALFIVLAQALGPKRPNPAKDMPFECGKVPFSLPIGRQSVGFYLAGMLFVLFDVELIFFFPWAVLYRKLGVFGFVEMMVFISILILGFVYAWRKGALQWK